MFSKTSSSSPVNSLASVLFSKRSFRISMEKKKYIPQNKNIVCKGLFVIIHIYPMKKKTLHYNIEKHVLTNAGYKYSDVINDLNWDVVVSSLSCVRLALTGKLKSSTRLFCFQISNFRNKRVFLLLRLSFVNNLSC